MNIKKMICIKIIRIFEYMYFRMWPISVDCSDYIVDVNECNGSPCLNAGVCINTAGDYQCVCQNGFTGNRCEKGNNFTKLP